MVRLHLWVLLLWPHNSNIVAFEVSIKGTFGLEALSTDAAAIGFLSSMDQDVSFQVHILYEALPTDLAQKSALLVVEADVRVERLFLGEAFSADATGECLLTTVNLQVCLQIPALVEGLPADVAAVRFLPSVNPQVHLQGSVRRERLPAHITRVAGVHVGPQMRGETGAVFILVTAEAAAAVRIVQVTLRVCHQASSFVKRGPANFAAVGFCRPAFLWFSIFPMRCHVAPEAPPVAELLATQSAGVHVLSAAMLRHVPLQGGQMTEAASTVCALEDAVRRVHAAMRLEVSHQAELFSAHGATEWFLSSVQADVQLLSQDGLKGFTTEGARLTALLVRLQVSCQLVCRVQTLATEATESVWVGGTNLQHMLEQESFAVQRAATYMTQEALRGAPALRLFFERRPSPLLSPDWTWSLVLFSPVAVRLPITTSQNSFGIFSIGVPTVSELHWLMSRILGNDLQRI